LPEGLGETFAQVSAEAANPSDVWLVAPASPSGGGRAESDRPYKSPNLDKLTMGAPPGQEQSGYKTVGIYAGRSGSAITPSSCRKARAADVLERPDQVG
jgi:iron(III) transport system substrate-binding protein